MTEQLAVMKNVTFGVRDTDYVKLWFEVEFLNGAAGLSLTPGDAVALMEKHGIVDIRRLENRPCVIDVEEKRVKFVRLK